MKVKVSTEFKDKHTEQIHYVGEELEMSVDRINEVLKIGNFIELIAESVGTPEQEEVTQTEPTEQSEEVNQEPETDGNQEETVDAGEQVTEEAPKQTTRRKRSK